MLSNTWIVTSTINTNWGLIEPQARFEQTIQTLISIRQHDPHSQILLIDNSNQGVNIDQYQLLSSHSNCVLMVGHRSICQQFNNMGIKGAGEAYMLLVALDALKRSNNTCNRIFKLSGRYSLSNSFDWSIYQDQQQKFCFKKLETNEWGQPFLHSRLWSSCGTLQAHMAQLISRSLCHMLHNNVTLEVALAACIDLTRLTQFDKIHCEGYIAPWNRLVVD